MLLLFLFGLDIAEVVKDGEEGYPVTVTFAGAAMGEGRESVTQNSRSLLQLPGGGSGEGEAGSELPSR